MAMAATAAMACQSSGSASNGARDSARAEPAPTAARESSTAAAGASETPSPPPAAEIAAARERRIPRQKPMTPPTPQSRPTPQASTGAQGTSPAPGVTLPTGSGTPAYVVFRDSVGAADLEWLRKEGFTIEKVFASSHSVSLRMPADYTGNPKANPRVLRFNVAMR